MLRPFRLVIAIAAIFMLVLGGSAHGKLTPRVTVTYPSGPTAGKSMTVTVKVSPVRSGYVLRLQRRVGRSWVTSARATTTRRAKTRLTWRPALVLRSATLRVALYRKGKRVAVSGSKTIRLSRASSTSPGVQSQLPIVSDPVPAVPAPLHGDLDSSVIPRDAEAPAPGTGGPRPDLRLPFHCNESWSASTYGGHGNALDWNQAGNADEGRPVVASQAGSVFVAPFGQYNGGYGNYVVVNHGGGWTTLYAHLSSYGASNGQSVGRGQVVGYVGNTGNSYGAHLHYEQRLDRQAQPIANSAGAVPAGRSYASDNCEPPPPPEAKPIGNHYVYFRGSDGAVHIMYWNGSTWTDQTLGGSMAAGSSPSGYTAPNGNHYVYFRGSDGAVHIMYWNGSTWTDQTLGGSMAAGSSPSGYTAPNGNHYVYFRGSDGAVHIMYWNGSTWTDQTLGGSMAAGSSPSGYTAPNGNHYVYFRGSDGAVHIMYWNGSTWTDQTLGGSMAAGSSPSGYTAPNGNHYVYFRGSDGAVHIMYWNGSTWTDQTLGGSMAAGSSPSGYTAPNGNHYVYFRGSDGAVHIMYWNGSTWQDQLIGGSMSSSPWGYTAPNGNHYVYFRGSDGAVHIMYWNGATWQDQTLGGSMAEGGSPTGYTN